VDIRTTDIFRLHIESDLDWKSAPRKDALFTSSQWVLNGAKAQLIVFSMAGRIMQLTAQRMTATDGLPDRPTWRKDIEQYPDSVAWREF